MVWEDPVPQAGTESIETGGSRARQSELEKGSWRRMGLTPLTLSKKELSVAQQASGSMLSF